MTTKDTSPDSNRLPWIDTHCHFDFDAFHSNRSDIWKKCLQEGCHALIIPGIHPDQWLSSLTLKQSLKGLHTCAGLHPWWIEKHLLLKDTHTIENNKHERFHSTLEDFCSQHSPLAIGECGLDKRISCPLDIQIQVLCTHIDIAIKMNKPIILHCIKAHNEMLGILARYPKLYGVIHGYSGSYEQAKQYWNKNIRIGIGGVISYPRARKTQQAIKSLPLEALLLETDAPDMPLYQQTALHNSPLNIPHILTLLSKLKNLPRDSVSQQLVKNTFQTFPDLPPLMD